MEDKTNSKEKKISKITKDTWNLDHAFLKWLKPRLKCYYQDASKIIDLEQHKFTFRGATLTQKQIIERMNEILKKYNDRNFYYFSDDATESENYLTELLELWSLVFPTMWW